MCCDKNYQVVYMRHFDSFKKKTHTDMLDIKCK